jgi:gamma-glutamyltranspeptidase
LRVLDLKQPIADALSGCRIHHQWSPETLLAEKANLGENSKPPEKGIGTNDPYAITQETIDGLQSLGHAVRTAEALAIAQGIQRLGNRLKAAHDPRGQGSSAY